MWLAVRQVPHFMVSWYDECMERIQYTVKIHPALEGGYWAEVPALPGCVTQAETLPELERNLHEEPAEGHLFALVV